VEALLSIALSNAVVAILLALIAAAVARFCRRPALRHALWLLVLLKLITPPLVPLSLPWPRTEEAEPATAEPPPPTVTLPPATEPAEPSISLPESREPAAAPAADPPAAPPTFAEVWMPLVMALWLGGSLCWWTVAAVRLRRFQRLMCQTRPAPEDVQEQARRLAVLLGLRRCPPAAFTSAPLSPMLWALGFSPRLLLPAELWQRLGMEQQDTLLAHELAHLRRGDHWVRRLEFIVLGLYWWHPVVWWARRRLQEAEEECCDALVVSILPDAASAYASVLVETVAFLSQTRPAALVGASGAGQVPLLKRRLTMILTETSSRKPSRIGFWIVLGLGALLLPLAPRAARTEAPEEPKRVELKARIDDSVKARIENINVHTVKAKDCIACHQPVVMDRHDFRGKPGQTHPSF
jgi:bla regulator protein BlaR1